jgi:hypothetical protein
VTQERLDFVPTSSSGPDDDAPAEKLSWRADIQVHRKAWMALRGLREIVVIGATYSLYDITRYFVSGDHDVAVRHGRAIFRFEQRLGIDPEHALNNLFSSHIALGLPADYFYATLHYIVTPLVLIWLWRRHPSSYPPARTVLIATTVIGLVGFSLLPVAPPRLLGGFVDTMAHFSRYGWWSTAGSAPRGLGGDTNQFAAMPSLHVGWAVWSGWQLFRHARHRVVKILGVIYPFVLSIVVIATANHYLLDVLAGFAVVGLGVGVARLFSLIDWRFGRGSPARAAPPAAAS